MNTYNNPYAYGAQQMPEYYPQQMPQMQQNMQQKPQQIIDGFDTVRSIEEARNYPVAQGTCMTLKIENTPYICTKARGFSMLESPQFKKFRLEEVDDNDELVIPEAPKYVNIEDYQAEHEKLVDQIRKLETELKKLQTRKRPKVREEDDYDE